MIVYALHSTVIMKIATIVGVRPQLKLKSIKLKDLYENTG